MSSPLIIAMHRHPVRFCVITLATVLPIVWALAPANGILP